MPNAPSYNSRRRDNFLRVDQDVGGDATIHRKQFPIRPVCEIGSLSKLKSPPDRNCSRRIPYRIPWVTGYRLINATRYQLSRCTLSVAHAQICHAIGYLRLPFHRSSSGFSSKIEQRETNVRGSDQGSTRQRETEAE